MLQREEALGTRLRKVWTEQKKVRMMHMFEQIQHQLFFRLFFYIENFCAIIR